MKKKTETPKDTLISLLRQKRDLRIALQQNWYRIPVKSAPRMVRDKTVKYVALYQPKVFQEEAFQIHWYGIVQKITIVKRKNLFPEENLHPRANEDYYKIEFAELCRLATPIINRKKRRTLFITTTFSRFQQAKELNDIFHEDQIEK